MLIIDTYEEKISETKRQVNICNACRYCESLCSVFPAISQKRAFSDTDITQLANLCHNCRGCYYACQYTAPHEFAINIPKALAEVRQESWQQYATPKIAATYFHQHGSAMALLLIVTLALFIGLFQIIVPSHGAGFYGVLSHNMMISLFIPAFVFPVISMAISIRRYWQSIGGARLRLQHIKIALVSVAQMKNLAGGHGDGCNFEDEDRFSHTRRRLHQAVMYGFLLCFGATSSATVFHYALQWPAPYTLLSLPKLLGLSGGIALCIGTLGMAALKLKADKTLSDPRVWGGEMGFILLLFVVSASGLALYVFGSSQYLSALLAFHLAAVLTFFLLMPFSKMVHGFYRLAALLYNAQQ